MAGRNARPPSLITFVQTPVVDDPKVQRALETLQGAVQELQSKLGGTDVSLFTATTDGTVPASGGSATDILHADGTWSPEGASTPPTRIIATTSPLAGGGDLTADRTFYISPGADGEFLQTTGGVVVWGAGSSYRYSDSIFSGGQDGAINFNGGAVSVATLVGSTYTLTQNVAATDINVAATYIVVTAGYAMFWTGTLSGSGTIRNNGSAGASIVTGAEAGSGGAGASGATLPAGVAGGNGAINSGSGASGGTGTSGAPVWNPVGAGGAAGAATPGSGTAGTAGGICKGGGSGGRGGGGFSVGAQAGTAGGSVGSINSDSGFAQCLVTGRTVTGSLFGGSTGGGGAPSPDSYNDFPAPHGADGAGGGGSGGWVVLVGDICTFTGLVEAKGGAGGNGYSFNVAGAAGGIGGPGAGGGAGGTIVMFIGAGALPTLDISGGAGGTGGACTGGTVDNLTAPNGGAGGSGKVISRVLSA
jgi:hypothetical protein